MAELKSVIAVLDDTETNLIIIKEILKPYYDVRVAKTPDKALKLLMNFPVKLLLLDIEMPRMNGFEFMEVVKKIPEIRDIPVIFVTSHRDKEYVAAAIQSGAKYLVSKPIQADHLIERIKSVLSPSEKVAVGNPVTTGLLEQLRRACTIGSISESISVAGDLRRMTYDSDVSKTINDIVSQVMSLNFTDARKSIDKLLN